MTFGEGTWEQVLSGEARWTVEHGDVGYLLWRMPDDSVDLMVTDPPAAVSFMGRAWDSDKGGRDKWIAWLANMMTEAWRVLKPGAHAFVWALPRTVHYTGEALEQAGFEIRDSLQHLFASGMPKSLNHLGMGRGTGLKPAHEVWFLVRKPCEGTVRANLEKHGTGALNIDACRVAHAGAADLEAHQQGVDAIKARGGSMAESWKNSSDLSGANDVNSAGRWPPNLLLSHAPGCVKTGTRAVAANPTWDTPNRDTEPSAFAGAEVSKVRHGDDAETVDVWSCVDGCPVRELAKQSGESSSTASVRGGVDGGFMTNRQRVGNFSPHTDSGTAARYFPQFQPDPEAQFLYCPKPARSETERGLDHFRRRSGAEATDSEEGQKRLDNPRTGAGRTGGVRNVHPTKKAIELTRWLARLIAPPGGVCLVPFAGSGSEMIGALLEGCRVIGCEAQDTEDEPFVSIARARIVHVMGGESVPRDSLRAAASPKQRSLFTEAG